MFGTKLRQPQLTVPLRESVYKDITGIIKNKGGRLIRIGGVEDHVHNLTTFSPTVALADFIRDIESNSSRWF